eukprot:scaffold3119_cov123-Skeletonema_marinoi.AAC.3
MNLCKCLLFDDVTAQEVYTREIAAATDDDDMIDVNDADEQLMLYPNLPLLPNQCTDDQTSQHVLHWHAKRCKEKSAKWREESFFAPTAAIPSNTLPATCNQHH